MVNVTFKTGSIVQKLEKQGTDLKHSRRALHLHKTQNISESFTECAQNTRLFQSILFACLQIPKLPVTGDCCT